MDQKQNITLYSLGNFEKSLLDELARIVAHELNRRVTIRDGYIDLIAYYEPSRRQYNGDLLLKKIETLISPEDEKTIGLFNVDLFIPILTYIFGQARLNGAVAIASIYRLKNDRYGMPPNQKLAVERFKKEVLHELGHAYGLLHCLTPDCVMRSSTYVEDIDQKNSTFCHHCRHQLAKNQ